MEGPEKLIEIYETRTSERAIDEMRIVMEGPFNLITEMQTIFHIINGSLLLKREGESNGTVKNSLIKGQGHLASICFSMYNIQWSRSRSMAWASSDI